MTRLKTLVAFVILVKQYFERALLTRKVRALTHLNINYRIDDVEYLLSIINIESKAQVYVFTCYLMN